MIGVLEVRYHNKEFTHKIMKTIIVTPTCDLIEEIVIMHL